MKKAALFALCISAIAPHSIAHADGWSAIPFTGTRTLGGHLESVYQGLLSSCGIVQPVLVEKSCRFACGTRTISAVPLVLQTQTVIPLSQEVVWNDSQWLAR